jgi:hypothetical protein
MGTTIQWYFRKRKKYSLVLNDHPRHHGVMNTTTTTRTHGRAARLRTFLTYAWGDSVAAHRAMPRVPPYDDYLFNHRGER